MSQNNHLPTGWSKAPFHLIGRWFGGGTPSKENKAYWTGGTIPWASPKDMKSLRVTDTEDHLSLLALDDTGIQKCPKGTVLVVVRSGILSRTLPVGVTEVPATMNQDLKGIWPHKGIDALYLAYFMIGSEQNILRQCSKHGTTVASINVSALKAIDLPLAPTNEQRRIVQKIEELFSKLDAGVACLERVKAGLRRYRATVLKAAVEGKLTAAWRTEHPGTEPASKLLKRILTERRRNWEDAQIARYEADGKTPPKGWREKYVEASPPDTSHLPDLPPGWCWATPKQLASPEAHSMAIGPFGSNLKVSDYADAGVPLVFVRNIRSGSFGNHDTKYISAAKASELVAHTVSSGDLLITKMGDPPGDACIYPAARPQAIITADCIKLRMSKLVVATSFFVAAFNSELVRKQIATITRGVAQQKVSLGRFASIALPIPPTIEQNQIVAEIDKCASLGGALARQVEADLLRASRLRQAILQRAFAGHLVAQDPADEPADKLLERIKSQNRVQGAVNRFVDKGVTA